MKKAAKIPIIVIGSITGLLLVVLLLVSPLAKGFLEKHDKELLGREVSIGKLWVNTLTGTLKIGDLTLYEDDDTTPFVSFDRLKVNVRVRDLFRNRLWVRHALLSGLAVNVEQDREWFNFNSLKDHFASNDTTSNSTGFKLVFNDINIDKSNFHYTDLARDSDFLLRDISIRIPSLDFSDLKTDVGLDLCLGEEATLHTDLRLSEKAKKYYINLKLSNLRIETIEPYLQQSYPIDVLNGFFHLDVDAQGSTDHILDFDLSGCLTFNEIKLQDTEGNDLGAIDSVLAKINRFSLIDKVLDFDKIHVSGLDLAYLVKADSTTNFDWISDKHQISDSTEMMSGTDAISIDDEEDKPWQVKISDLNFAQLQLLYEDHTLPENFHYVISDLCLSSKHFDLDGNNAVQMQATLNAVGSLRLNWQGNLQSLDNQNLTLMFNNVKIADFSPYIVQWFGFPMESGTLSFRSQNVISNGSLNGLNKLQIAAPQLGDKVKHIHPRYEKVPLRLGLYLLTDKHNNISIDLPVSGNLNDPGFSYGKTLRQVFFNLLAKVAASPFRLMTDEDNNLKYIPFDPLRPDFSPEQYVMIDNVVATLQSRSDLGIVLEQQVQYDEIIDQLCIMQLKRDYYFSIHPDKETSGLDFLTGEVIRSISLNDKGLCDFAATHSRNKKKVHSKKDLASVAEELYRKKSEKIVPTLMEKRNQLLSNYLLNIKGLSPDQIAVTSIDASLMKSFVKPSRYEMHVFRYEDME